MCVCVCACVHLSAGGGRIKSHFLIRKGPSWPSALLQWELVQHCAGTMGFVRLLAKKAPEGRQPGCIHTHICLFQGHTQACMIGVLHPPTLPHHVLSDGKSGLPFPPVHWALMSTIRLSLEPKTRARMSNIVQVLKQPGDWPDKASWGDHKNKNLKPLIKTSSCLNLHEVL